MAPLLYKLDLSPPASAVRMLAAIIDLELDLKEVDFANFEHKSSAYLKLNPVGSIPTLKDGDFAISDSHAIMTYLLSVYGADKSESLYPSDVRTRALVDQAMFFDTGVFFMKLRNVTLPSIFEGLPGPTDRHRSEIDDCYSVLEAYLQDRKYIATDHLTIADLAVGSTANAIQAIHKLDPAKFPRAADWLSRLEQETFFKKIMIPGTKILEELMLVSWEKNKQKQ